jgi:hypothetical protein
MGQWDDGGGVSGGGGNGDNNNNDDELSQARKLVFSDMKMKRCCMKWFSGA